MAVRTGPFLQLSPNPIDPLCERLFGRRVRGPVFRSSQIFERFIEPVDRIKELCHASQLKLIPPVEARQLARELLGRLFSQSFSAPTGSAELGRRINISLGLLEPPLLLAGRPGLLFGASCAAKSLIVIVSFSH